ncbi:MAG: chitobiase/beta-hexosaminidase C-terminal domain-containing protein [Niabella sp.]
MNIYKCKKCSIKINLLAVLCCCTIVANSQLPVSLAQEEKETFSYFKTAVDQLGFKDSPEGIAVTNGGTFSNAHLAVAFLYGDTLGPANHRVVLPEKGYLPIIGYTLKDNDINYQLEAFSVPKDFNPQNNLISYISWRITNTSKKPTTAKIGFNLISFYPNDVKNFLRHNMYCTNWYLQQFMNEKDYLENVNTINIDGNDVMIGNHLVLGLPQNTVFEKIGNDNKWTATIALAPGATQVLIFKMPFVPIEKDNASIKYIQHNENIFDLKQKLVNFWDDELQPITKFIVPEEKVMNMFKGSYVNILNARDILEDGKGIVQRCNEFQYDYFYVRDNAYFTRVYDMLGQFEDAGKILQPYFIKDIEGNDLQFQQRTGIYKKLCFDYWGQVLWAFGAHIRQTGDTDLLKRVYKLLPNHMQDFESMVGLDDRGLWPKTWPYDNEQITGHYTGHNFWVILGLRNAVFMANAMNDKKNIKEWTALYNSFSKNFKKELDKLTAKTGGYIPPGMDNPEDGYDWANASAGLYPFEAISKNDPAVKATLETVRKYNFQEGISSYDGCNALVAKQKVLNGQPLPWRGLHHYETFYVSNGNLILGEQEKCIEDLYSILVHTSSTNAGFEWRPTPWGNRDFEHNRAPHGWFAARYIEYLRNMLVREEGNDVHLLSAISPEWAKNGDTIKVNDAPTYFGNVNYSVSFSKNKINVRLHNSLKMDGGKIYFHIPWFANAKSVIVDGRIVTVENNTIEILNNTKEIIINWNAKTKPQQLNYNTAVKYYLNKYYNKPLDANYATLFPALAAPGFIKNENNNELRIFSPDNFAPVYYTTDGSEPDKKAAVYSKPILVKPGMLVKAVCIDKRGEQSDCSIITIQ